MVNEESNPEQIEIALCVEQVSIRQAIDVSLGERHVSASLNRYEDEYCYNLA